LVTGCAGFLGSHLSERLIQDGHEVVGVDCLTDFYPRALKERNLARLRDEPRFSFEPLDLSEDRLEGLLEGITGVFHLAAQPGVRGSFGSTFHHYTRNNVLATQALLEQAGADAVKWFVYASSSSVYGDAPSFPSAEHSELCPVSPYGMTKLATEQIASVYFRTAGVPVIGLRYFTAYGPRQRPDMAFSRFLHKALAGEPLPILGDGRQVRDFTYVSDIVEGTLAATAGEPGSVYNIGGGHAVELNTVVQVLEELLERPLEIERRPALRGDARRTCADNSKARRELGFEPSFDMAQGLAKQLEWTLEHTGVAAGCRSALPRASQALPASETRATAGV
jgi:nucleoside-diphosphate-sugar epimerase